MIRPALAAALAIAIGLGALPGAAAPALARPTARLTVAGTTPETCPDLFTCVDFTATCTAPHDDVAPLAGKLAIGRFSGARRGTLVAFGGGGGQDYWLAGGQGRKTWKKVAEQGIELISVAWDSEWQRGLQGVAALGCRPAAAIEWAVARHLAAGSDPPPGAGVCGLCIIGYSVGTEQLATALGFYDLAGAVDAAVVVSGPPTADITAGCRRDGSPLQYLEPGRNAIRGRIDDSFDDHAAGPGSCEVLPTDLSAAPLWDANSLVAGGLDFPTTRFHFVWGDHDPTGAVGQGMTYLAALSGAGSPLLAYDCVGASHGVFETRAGRLAIVAALLWEPTQGLNVPPVPDASLSPRCTRT